MEKRPSLHYQRRNGETACGIKVATADINCTTVPALVNCAECNAAAFPLKRRQSAELVAANRTSKENDHFNEKFEEIFGT